MRGSRGGPGVRTPLRFVRSGVLCGYLMDRRGGPGCFYLIFIFFSGSLRLPLLFIV